jgi:protein-tyrosine kinase
MERIKQALEKARQLQPKVGGQQSFQESKSFAKANPAKSDEINCDHTRLSELNTSILEKNRIVSFNKGDPTSLLFDILRTKVLQMMEDNGWRTLAITSPIPACGKTMVAINLAMSIAQHTNKSALLVDFDLRRPSIGKYLGISTDKSLNDLVDGTISLPEALVNPGIPRLVVLPSSRPFKNPAETLSSTQMKNLILELRDRYQDRIVIFDLPPILSADDVISVLPKIDCVLMVVGNGMVSKQELEDSVRNLRGAHLLGTVLNKADVKPQLYYY